MTTRENNFVHCKYLKPILTVTIKKGTSTDEDIEFVKVTMGLYYQALEKFDKKMSVIYDLRKTDIKNIAMVTKWAALFNSMRDKATQYINKSGVLTDSTLFSSVSSIYLKLYTPARPYKVSHNINELKKFIKD